MWRGSAGDGSSEDVFIPPEHDSLDVLSAIRDASKGLYTGCASSDKRKRGQGAEPCVEDYGMCKCFRSSFININHVYTALLLYAHRRRQSGRAFKLKTVCLAGDLGGRGVNFKPHGTGHDPVRKTWIVEPHYGYLTDMFFMFDAVVNRQITTHGEYTLQAIGRLCTLVNDAMLSKMATTPPRLWTSISCYNVIRTFALGVDQWVQVMRSKAASEPIKDAVVRSIRSAPESFRELFMIYVVPYSDERWAKKELWLHPSRLKTYDSRVGQSVRAAPRLPLTPAQSTHGIQNNPDQEANKRMRHSISKARTSVLARREAMDGDEMEESPAAAAAARARRSRRVARNPDAAEMRERFASHYSNHPEKERACSGQRMPKFNDIFYKRWDPDVEEYHRVQVTDIEWDDVTNEMMYHLVWLTNDDGSVIDDDEQKHAEWTPLCLAMSDWTYDDPDLARNQPPARSQRPANGAGSSRGR